MNIKLMTECHMELLSLKGGCTGSSETIHHKMPHFMLVSLFECVLMSLLYCVMGWSVILALIWSYIFVLKLRLSTTNKDPIKVIFKS